jgi:Ca-activated chloride channel homolog
MRGAIFQRFASVIVMQVALAAGQAPSFRTETRLVVLHATVLNSRGEGVTGLGQSAFTVFENGKLQPITLFRRDDVPISVGLLIDNSGSMRPLRSRVERAALAFARASNPQDELFVLNFADRVHVDVPMTSDIRVLEAGIARVDSIGGTALRDAVRTGELYLRDHAKWDRRVLLIITDGFDNASETTVDQIRRQAEMTDTTIEAIGLFSGDDQGKIRTGRHELASITERTGGGCYFPTDVGQIEADAVAIARQIRNQYTIAYMPLDQRLNNSYRSIRLSVSGPDRYSVRTKSGYRAASVTP